jgi:DNA-binding transcriptional MerR regulator
MTESSWRIDDLAQRAGVSVDNIRYYAREGLLPPGTRSGRITLYGPEHLDRLARIRELRERHFSLAAIRALVTADRPGLDALFLGAVHEYSYEELLERSDVGADLVTELQHIGLLADPATFGRDSYDDSDLRLMQSVRELLDVGMTPEILLELGRIYVRHFGELQQEVHGMLAGWNNPEWDSDAVEAMQRSLTANVGRMLPAVDQVLNYVHQRTVQRLTIEAIRTARETGTGIGGIKNPPALDF